MPAPVFETEMADAARAGRQAARARQPRGSCPHRLDADTAPERVLAIMWCRGWDDHTAAAIRILPDDYDGPDQ